MIELVLFLFLSPPAQALPDTATSAVPVVVKSEVPGDLGSVKRIYVDSFGDDATSRQAQAMVVSALTASQRFIITENKEKADAILRGTALEKTSQEFHALNDKAAASSAAGGHSGSLSGSWSNGTGSISGSSSGGFAARRVAVDDSSASTETIDHARVAVRLVSHDGDVIWATTQESKGAKYKGASADVADKIVKQLLRDIEKLEKAPSTATVPAK
jgi:curli biogenesis system outer membrane secretion channel CsgG